MPSFNMRLINAPAACLLALLACGCSAVSVTNLRCDGLKEPLNVDSAPPRLSWNLISDQRGQGQTAYQVLVASTPDILASGLGDLWDSGKVSSDSTIDIPCGPALLWSRQSCWWKVRVWDSDGKPSDWSPPAHWSMGLLSPADWIARWITPPPGPATQTMPIFRRQFALAKPVRRAVMYICGLGQFELHLNGKTVSDDLLQPGWTNYRKTCLYVAYDVTDLLHPGDNAIGVMLGNGMYDVPNLRARYHKFIGSFGPPMLIAQMHIDYADGTSDLFATDAQWKVAPGPITFSSIYGGEDDDARLLQTGWDQPGFDASGWSNAVETPGPGGKLFGDTHSAPPIRVAKILDAIKITEPRPGVQVYDFGQNCAQLPRIVVTGQAGDMIRLTPGELLAPTGLVSQASSGKGFYYQYTLNSDGVQTWSPRFSYYGSRYLQVEGTAAVQKIQGCFITSTSPSVGDFACSSDLFNRTATLIRWAMESNTVSVLTDCPHRERLGWLEQDHLMGPSLMYNHDLQSLLEKICDDMSDSQLPSGFVPNIAPEYTVLPDPFRDSIEWGSAAVLLPWNLYQWYGDTTALSEHYDMMRRYVAYLAGKASSGIISYGLGDWYDLGKKPPGKAQLTPIALTATAFYFRDLQILQQTAHLLGREDEAAAYARQITDERAAFNGAFYSASDHRYATGSQTADALPLVFGLAGPDDAPGVLADLVADVRNHKSALTAGDVGYRYVLRALADGNRSDVIFDMNNRSDRPGYGWQLVHGATSLTEAWDAGPRSSQDHFMLGHIMEWFYSDLAGIQQQDDSVAFQHIRIKPSPVGDVTWARATYDSVRGPIKSSWRIDGKRFTLDVTIPCGCDALIYVPGSQMEADSGAKYLRDEAGYTIFAVQSGRYSFTGEF